MSVSVGRPAAAGPARTALATVCISGTLEDKLTAAAAAGFDGVEIFEPDLVASLLSPAQLRVRCADLGLSIDLYQPFRDFDAAKPDLLEANLRRAERKFDVMEELGTELRPLFVRYKTDRIGAERFGDWCDRVWLKENPFVPKAPAPKPAAVAA